MNASKSYGRRKKLFKSIMRYVADEESKRIVVSEQLKAVRVSPPSSRRATESTEPNSYHDRHQRLNAVDERSPRTARESRDSSQENQVQRA